MGDEIDCVTKPGGSAMVRAASTEDAERVLAVMRDATRWLESRGITQWGWTATDEGRGIVRKRVEKHEVYLAVRDGQDVGTLTLQWSDPAFWGEERGNDGSAGYVHGLAVVRAAAGAGLGAALLRFAEDKICAAGRPLIRLDSMLGNPHLLRYYAGLGFTHLGEVHFNGFSSALFERPIAKETP